MKEIIRTLPNNKRIVFQQKYERIINNIPLEQIELYKIKMSDIPQDISTEQLAGIFDIVENNVY